MTTTAPTTPTTPSTGTNSASDADAAATASAASQEGEFLQMLLAQLQNQNPLDPQSPQDFAAQLAQYSQLEQQIDTNTKLDTLISNLSSGASTMSPVSYLGTTVDYSSNIAPVQNAAATWSYSTTGASAISISITDSSGDVLYTGAGDTSAGAHLLTLNQLTDVADGTPLTITVTATDSSGNAVTPVVTARATIDAVDTSSGTTSLEADGYEIPVTSVQRIATTTPATNTSSNTSS